MTLIAMKILRPILIFFALLAGSISKGETVLVTATVGGCQALHILTVYQSGSEVLVTKYLEETGFICGASIQVIEATFNMSYPSIALKEREIISLFEERTQILYRNGKIENAYDPGPDWGDGWVDTPAVGFINLKSYPWIFHPNLGWLFVVEGEIVENKLDNAPSPRPKGLSFYLYSEEHGWLWTTEFTDKYYLFADMEFKTVEEITGN